MNDTRLDRPRSEARLINALADRDGRVLVPRHLPIRLRVLVEQNGTHDSRRVWQKSLRQTSETRKFRDRPRFRQQIESIADRKYPAPAAFALPG